MLVNQVKVLYQRGDLYESPANLPGWGVENPPKMTVVRICSLGMRNG